jgi:hypothetical protein
MANCDVLLSISINGIESVKRKLRVARPENGRKSERPFFEAFPEGFDRAWRESDTWRAPNGQSQAPSENPEKMHNVISQSQISVGD